MKITVIGSGYVGTTTAAILANCGYEVKVLDIDKERVGKVNSGKAPFYEAGLNNLIERGIKHKSLSATTSYKEAVPEADILFSCVGTPDNPDGSSNLTYIYNSAKEAAQHIKNGAIYVQKSTVPVGTGKKVEQIFRNNTKSKVSYVSNPEFLREGTAIKDTLLFDRIVVGGGDQKALDKVTEIYKQVDSCKVEIADIADVGIEHDKLKAHEGSYIKTSLESAELIKVSANAFLALKISFANSIAKIADQANADITEVMDGIGADERIGRAFLNAGRGYGGGCFPKDISGLISSANKYGVDLPIMVSSQDVNESMPGYIASKAKQTLKTFDGKNLAILGLSFKPGTSDVRKSPSIKLANLLVKDGAYVKAYDPEANGEASRDLYEEVDVLESWEEAAKNADAVFIATDWDEFTRIDLEQLSGIVKGKVLVDCMNSFDKNAVVGAGFTYIGVGR